MPKWAPKIYIQSNDWTVFWNKNKWKKTRLFMLSVEFAPLEHLREENKKKTMRRERTLLALRINWKHWPIISKEDHIFMSLDLTSQSLHPVTHRKERLRDKEEGSFHRCVSWEWGRGCGGFQRQQKSMDFFVILFPCRKRKGCSLDSNRVHILRGTPLCHEP